MLELEEALKRILDAVPPPTGERVDLRSAHGRILHQEICAPSDLPVFDNSSVDGYAVRAMDVGAAGAETPVGLRLIGRVAAGEMFEGELAAGTSVRLFTGSPLPRGADAVVMQEDTRVDPKRPQEVLILDPVRPWENIRFRGEDFKRGAVLMGPGESVTSGRTALLASIGMVEVSVGRCPAVGVLATGSELKEPGESLGLGQIYESNRAMLAPLIESAGGRVKSYPVVVDTAEATRAALERAFGETDLVVTCGGVSVGEMDFVKAAFESLGGSVQFWKVAIKPGRPFVFGRLGEKLLFGLPGNPVSAFVTFLLFVRPVLLRWQGARDSSLPSHPGVLAEALANPGGRRHFLRVVVDGAGTVRSAGVQASHILSSVAAANALVDVPPRTTLAAGTTVKLLRWT